MSGIDGVETMDLKNVASNIPHHTDKAYIEAIEPDLSFLPILEEAVACNTPNAAWHIEESVKNTFRWLWVYNDPLHLPEQGWKLHISATMLSTQDVLRSVLPTLLAESAAFKVAATPRHLGILNSGQGGISQVGKFITVYPYDDEQAVRLAVELDKATAGLRGPAVPSDRPLRLGSLVHYRYGGFSHLGMQDGDGNMHMAIRTPSGELVPDQRNTVSFAPEWAVDPFLSAGIAGELPPYNPLVGGRYLLVTAINQTPRGIIYQAVDAVMMRRCIVKRAMRDGAMGMDGMDAFDRLRNEARILSMLAPDPRFPRVYDTLDAEGDLLLAMEEVAGQNLQTHIRTSAVEGHTLPIHQLVSWGKELTAMLEDIHSKGLLYRDLKPSNVIVSPGGELRLIDFDVSMELPAERPLYSPGTIGYLSPQQHQRQAPTTADDIYALGALLYFMATGADPSYFPHAHDLLKRPPELLNPTLPASMVDVIRRCLEHEPHKRFQSVQEVALALDAVLPALAISHHDSADEVVWDMSHHRQRNTERYLDNACRLGDTLCHMAIKNATENGCYWINPSYADIPVVGRDLATGSAGPVLALAELVSELGDPNHREYLRAGATWLAAQPPVQNHPRPGLYSGEAGVALALLRAGEVLKDQSLLDEVIWRAEWIATLPFSTPGMFNGTAGRVRFHLLMWDATGDESHLNAAIAAGEALLASATEPAPGMFSWAMPPGKGRHDGRTYTGYALGAAGIGDALLDLFDMTSDLRFVRAADGALRWLESLAQPTLNDGSGLDWPQVEGEPMTGAFWGHGASGIGIFLLNARKHGLLSTLGSSRSGGLVERAALTAAYGARWGGPTLAYGLGGPTEFLLDAYQETSNVEYLDNANQLAAILETFSVEKDGYLYWPSESPTLYTPDFMVGYAGIATLMLRLAHPNHIPRVATLAASRRNRLQSVHRKLTAVTPNRHARVREVEEQRT